MLATACHPVEGVDPAGGETDEGYASRVLVAGERPVAAEVFEAVGERAADWTAHDPLTTADGGVVVSLGD